MLQLLGDGYDDLASHYRWRIFSRCIAAAIDTAIDTQFYGRAVTSSARSLGRREVPRGSEWFRAMRSRKIATRAVRRAIA